MSLAAASRWHRARVRAAIWRRRWQCGAFSRRATRRPSANGICKAERSRGRIFLPERYSEPLPRAEREALLSRSEMGRDFLAVTRGSRSTWSRSCSRTSTLQLLFLFKSRCSVPWLVDTLSGTSPMGSVIRAFRSAKRLSALPGGSFQSGARPDGDLHRVPAVVISRRSRSRTSWSRAAGPPSSTCRRPHRARPAIRWPLRSTCTRPSSGWSAGRSFRLSSFRSSTASPIHQVVAVRIASGHA